ncbi:alpha-L-fucosidase [Brachybacterium sp. P6-10-X1]|uniref:alpha-L-fucosidase n=1 Tax=Brachybacterium sp. P6-10-X1 TaxID=1903186 RepID=UPI0009717CD3|nr:alpha-L-fucosidase [Brachybacterium sp. P6-10-X1]APX34023.1 alpha-L-fucosidase [Brachybacterium sp. P6-10-X1]
MPTPSTSATPTPSTDWFDHDRFGMFIHFGLYAMPARHEWVMSIEERDASEYERYARYFDPDLFDAATFARLAKDAGMKYVVLTTKHHEGFCLWDTALSDYSAPQSCGRDLVREFADAVRAEGLKVGLYHSVLDWHHPDYTVDERHPLRNRSDIDSVDRGKDMARYRDYLHGQVRELLTDYGPIDYMFYDFTFPGEFGKGPEDWHAEELLAMTRELQPGIIVNDRLGIPGDLVTPEQYQPDSPMTDDDGHPVRWEACQTLNGSWGYDRDNLDFKSTHMLLSMLVDSVAKGGNLLLNIGPDGRGNVRDEDTQRLEDIGRWMHLHQRSVYGAGPATSLTAPAGTVMTQREDRVYVHFLAWPLKHLHLKNAGGRIAYAQLLNDASEVTFQETDPQARAWNTNVGGLEPGTVTFHLPVQKPDPWIPVLEIFLEE